MLGMPWCLVLEMTCHRFFLFPSLLPLLPLLVVDVLVLQVFRLRNWVYFEDEEEDDDDNDNSNNDNKEEEEEDEDGTASF